MFHLQNTEKTDNDKDFHEARKQNKGQTEEKKLRQNGMETKERANEALMHIVYGYIINVS
jgi:hypothetical protein